MKNLRLVKLIVFVIFLLLTTSSGFSKGLPDEWTEINPETEPSLVGFNYEGLTPACSNAPGTEDDKFTFFVKDGKKKNIVIFFQGGGACWDPTTCITFPTYTQEQDEGLDMFSDENEGYGIFDQTREENPFKDWGFVYIPYCTGDLFWGANDKEYTGFDMKTYQTVTATIQHRGFVNFQAVLTYLKENLDKPNKVFVTGSSAGSYGATMAFPYVKEAFPKSKAYLLGDAGNGVMGGTFSEEGIVNWNVQMPEWIFPNGYDPLMTVEEMYINIAAEYPMSPVAQYTTVSDSTQIFFLNVMKNIGYPDLWYDQVELGSAAMEWIPTMLGYAYNTADVSSNYRYYIAEGSDHTILMNPDLANKFYTEASAGGIFFSEWVKRMIQTPNNPVKWKNLECEDCIPAFE